VVLDTAPATMGGTHNFVFSGSEIARSIVESHRFDLPKWIDRLSTAFKYVLLQSSVFALNNMHRVAESGGDLFSDLAPDGDGDRRSPSEQPEEEVRCSRDGNRTSSRQLLMEALSELVYRIHVQLTYLYLHRRNSS
jgi:hypothetical protein